MNRRGADVGLENPSRASRAIWTLFAGEVDAERGAAQPINGLAVEPVGELTVAAQGPQAASTARAVSVGDVILVERDGRGSVDRGVRSRGAGRAVGPFLIVGAARAVADVSRGPLVTLTRGPGADSTP
jgi:hypothetical protein